MTKKAGSERRAKKEMRRGGIRRVYSGQDNSIQKFNVAGIILYILQFTF
jgi:hypothetical protein